MHAHVRILMRMACALHVYCMYTQVGHVGAEARSIREAMRARQQAAHTRQQEDDDDNYLLDSARRRELSGVGESVLALSGHLWQRLPDAVVAEHRAIAQGAMSTPPGA